MILEVSMVGIWDKKTKEVIKTLHPLIQEKAVLFVLTNQKEGRNVRIYKGYRSPEEQNKEKARGKSGVSAWGSYHQYGLAFDFVEIEDGVALWKNPNWETIAKVGIALGFEWGGYWKSLVDKPHLQYTYGYKARDLKKFVKSGSKYPNLV